MPASDPIALLLAGQYPDPETGELLGCEARSVAIDDTLAGREAELVESIGVPPGARLALIGDVDTYAALGDRVARVLASRFAIQRVELPHGPRADVETIARLVSGIDVRTDAIVTVGSGTLNDLSKMVAQQLDRPHAVFATAPSMNGYTSVSASIMEGGFKRSVRARTPRGVFLDLETLAAAPIRLIRAGLGDSLCRATAQFDWRLSHEILGTPYREVPFALLAGEERTLVEGAAALVRGDRDALRALARTLVLSGFGMTLVGGSYPASQSEHLVSHYLEMRPPHSDALHGEQTGVAAVAIAALQARVLARPALRLREVAIDRDALVAHYGPQLGEVCIAELAKKRPDIAAVNARLATNWEAIRDRLAAVAGAPETIVAALAAAGAPTTPAELGYQDDAFAEAIARAREIRDRYTVLDLMSGLDDDA